jgi:outer membrane protein assembly factor BamD
LGKRRYFDAAEQFRAILTRFPGSDLVDDSQFGLAEAYFGQEDYESARLEYERILTDFPLSSFVPRSQFKVAACYFRQSRAPALDQTDTERAIEEYERFLDEFPTSELVPKALEGIGVCREKLAEKEYRNGRLYLKLGKYDAAIIEFQMVLDAYGDTRFAPLAQYEIARTMYRQKRYAEARVVLLKLEDDPRADRVRKDVRRLLERIGEHPSDQDLDSREVPTE